MSRRFRILPILLCLLVGAVNAVAMSPLVELRGSEDLVWEEEISLDLKDAEIGRVVTLVFQIAEQPVDIDDCVEGAVSLKFENVRLRDALESVARMGNLRIRPMREGYGVDCGVVDPSGVPDSEGQLLEFTLTDVHSGTVITRPKLLVLYDSLAEITVGSVETEDLDGRGEFFAGDREPGFRIKTYLRKDREHPGAGQLRGIFEIATRAADRGRTTLMAAHSFEVALPAGSVDLPAATIELGGKEYELAVSRPAR